MYTCSRDKRQLPWGSSGHICVREDHTDIDFNSAEISPSLADSLAIHLCAISHPICTSTSALA